MNVGINRIFKAGVINGFERTSGTERRIISNEDIDILPELIQKYLKYVGIIGKEQVRNLKTISEIKMNFGSGRETNMIAEEFNFFDNTPSRLVLMKFKVKGIPIVGLDSYIDGKGRMLMKLFGLFTVTDGKGHDMDNTSAAVMLLLNMCLAAPSCLIDDRIKWSDVSSSSIRATFNDNGCIVSAVLYFNEKGELTKFTTDDKFYSPKGNTYEKVSWSTVIKNYENVNGQVLSTYGEAIWHFPDGDFCYGKLTLKQIEYNINK